MLLRRSTSGCIWCIVLALVLGLVGIHISTDVSGTQAQGNSFVFTAHGDHGAYNDPDTLASLNAVAGTGAAFSLALGDMNYESVGDELRWCQTVQGILGPSYPFEIVMGNHEDEDKVNGYIGNFVKYCPDRMNAQGIYGAEYFFDYPAADPLMRVIMIGAGNDWDWDGSGTLESDEYFDYDSTTPARRAHLGWLIDKIDSARSAGIRWIVVGMHKNCITVAKNSCEIGSELLNVLVEKKVDLILQGHDHTYQRSKQLSLGPGCSSIAVASYGPDCVVDDGADGVFEKGAGPIVLVAGHFGGGDFSSVSPSDPESGYFAKAMGGNGWFDFLQNDALHLPASRGFVKFVVSDSRIDVEHVATTDLGTGFSDVFSIVASGSPTPVPTYFPSATPIPSKTLTFTPTDDATIRADNPTTNYGKNAALEVDASSVKDILLRFNVNGIGTQSVSKATLRLFAVDASSSGGDLFGMTNPNWSETTVTWDAAPFGDGELLGALGSVAIGYWYEIDVTSLVTEDGPVSVRVRSSNANGADYSSKENVDGNAPELIVELSGSPRSTATAAPTPASTVTDTPTNTPSSTQTSTATFTPTALRSAASTTVSLVPAADAYVYSSNPYSNYGASAKLRTDGSPDTRSYVRFDVQGISGTVTNAILRVYANTASSAGYNVNRVSDSSWIESGLTYNNAPAVGTITGSSGPFNSYTWTTVDVTALVAGNGLLTLALTPIDGRAVSISSHEGANPPELVITFTSQASATLAPTDTPTPTDVPQGSGSNTDFQPEAPYYASFFYLWYQQPNTNGVWSYWIDHGNNPPQSWFSHYLPDYRADVVDPASELYSSMNYDVFKWQVSKLAEAKQEVAIASWWGPGRKEDVALQTIVNAYMPRADNPYPNLRWCIYYEAEGYADESVDMLVANLEYIKSTLASSSSYLKVDGKPVIFVYAGANDSPGTMTQRWKQANAQIGGYFYVVLKVFPGYEADINQPDSWHQYAPAVRGEIHGSYSAFVSPGFWLDNGNSSPRLPRSLSEFEAAVINMVNANVTWKLVETWNEWGEGTSVEPGDQVIETSGGEAVLDPNGPEFGNAYVDILNAYLPPLESGNVPTAAAFTRTDTTLPTDASTATFTPTATQISATSLQIVETDDPSVLQTGEWTAYDTEVASGGRYIFSSGSPNDTLTVLFVGTRADVIYVTHPALGTFGIEVDGVLVRQVNSTTQNARFAARATVDRLSQGQHMLRIYPIAGTIAIDAFAVVTPMTLPSTPTPTAVLTVPVSPTQTFAVVPADTLATPTASLAPDGNPQWVESDDASVLRSGEWTVYGTEPANGGRYIYSSGSADDTLTVLFEGTTIDVIYVKHPALGAFGIEIDGVLMQAVDSTAPDSVFGAHATVNGLPDGQHTLRIYPLAGTIAIDAFAFEPTTTLLPTPTPTSVPPDGVTPPGIVTELAPTMAPTGTPLPAMLPYMDTLDSGQGWSASGAWQFDTQTAYSGASWAADSTQRGLVSTLTGDKLIDLRSAVNPELSFWQKAALSDADVFAVEISWDGGVSWVILSEQIGPSHEWTLRTLDLTPYRGNVIRLRYHLDTTGVRPGSTTTAGVWIDQLSMQDLPPATTDVPTPAVTATEMPTGVPTPTATPTVIPTNTPTDIPTPIVIPTDTPMDTLAPTVIPTDMSADVPTPTPNSGT